MTDVTQKKIRVIYIAGTGRSGSTLLATLLGSHADVFSAGELCNLNRAWQTGEYCSCGVPADRCEFWRRVFERWQDHVAPSRVEDYPLLQNRFERLRRWPRVLWQQRISWSETFRQYTVQTRALLESICEVSGKTTIVDSSKKSVRFGSMAGIANVDVRVIHLVRDVRAVAWSQKKPYRQDQAKGLQRSICPTAAWQTTVAWLLGNLATVSARKSSRLASTLIRYEDLVTETDKTIRHISKLTGIDFSQVSSAAVRGEPIHVDHQIAGNRLRMRGAVRLQADWEWFDRLDPTDRRVCWALAGWLAKRFGYQRISSQRGGLSTPVPPKQPMENLRDSLVSSEANRKLHLDAADGSEHPTAARVSAVKHHRSV